MMDREKVIKGLECCIFSPGFCPDDCTYKGKGDENGYCDEKLIKDAFALLKSQEPRVMTEKEIEELQDGTIVWYEQNAGDYRFIRPMIADGRGMIGDATIGIKLKYLEKNSERLWTTRPTDEQREATKWTE